MAKRAKSKKVVPVERSAAIVTIKGPGRMTKGGRAQIARWLRKHADMLVKEGALYTEGVFRGRFIYAD